MSNIEKQLQIDNDFGHKCAMLLLGMHRWINQQSTNVTFTPNGNLAYQIRIKLTLDPTKYIMWGNDENRKNPYVAIPLYYMDNGNHIHLSFSDNDGRELITSTYTETSQITMAALQYCWGQIPDHEELESIVEQYMKAASKEKELTFEEARKKAYTNITSDNDKDRIPADILRKKHHWYSQEIANITYLLEGSFSSHSAKQSTDSTSICDAIKSEYEKYSDSILPHRRNNEHPTWEENDKSNNQLTIALLLGIRKFINIHQNLFSGKTPKDTSSKEEEKKQNHNAEPLIAFLLLLSNLCEQYPVIIYVPQNELQQKMLFNIKFDDSYRSTASIDDWLNDAIKHPQKTSVTSLNTIKQGRKILEFIPQLLLGPLHLADHVNLSFQSYASRSSHIEVTPIENTVITNVHELVPQGQLKSKNTKNKPNETDIRIQSSAGRIHCARYMNHHRSISRIRLTIFPDYRSLRYSSLWAMLLCALSLLNLYTATTECKSLASLFSGDNLIAGLSMIFTLWLAKTLSGINNSISDHIRKKLDDTISKSLIFYSFSYAITFFNTNNHTTTNDCSLHSLSSIIPHTPLDQAEVLVSLVPILIFIKTMIWLCRYSCKIYMGREYFINSEEHKLHHRVYYDPQNPPAMDTLEKAPYSVLAENRNGEFILEHLDSYIKRQWSRKQPKNN